MGTRSCGYSGNETAYQLARAGSEHAFIGHEPASGISVGVAQKAVRDWTKRIHKNHWESITGLKQAKGLIPGPSARRTKDLLKLNRDQLIWVVGLLTGHCHLKGQITLFAKGGKNKMNQPHISYVILRP
jgi:hypothetical protein